MKLFTLILLIVASFKLYAAETVRDYIDDSTIAGKIIVKFVRSSDVSALELKTHVYQGEVQICGFADNEEQIKKALNLASSVEGVTKVNNGMDLKENENSSNSTDLLITSKVKALLIAKKDIPSSSISVLTENGRVQLCGFVRSSNVIQEVERIARKVKDVKSVENKLIKITG